MNRRLLILLLVASLAILFAAKLTFEQRRLARYRQFIETRFAGAIGAIEAGSRALPSRDDVSDVALAKREAIMAGIEQALAAPEVVGAGWTTDGHHGSEGLRRLDAAGYSKSMLYSSADPTGLHTLRRGTTFDGRTILIFEGVVPGGTKRHYEIVFLADRLDPK
jgi:hypothetical protein